MLEIGMTSRADTLVSESNTALALGSGDLEVFATPAMIALMEGCAAKGVAPCLEEGQTTVGSFIEASHTRPSPVGMEVWAESRLTGIEGRTLTFEITACDLKGEIGRAVHRRAVVDAERFMGRCRG